jgi:phosphoenolpyruvate---glycerone phosphotransferase subunit DhaK
VTGTPAAIAQSARLHALTQIVAAKPDLLFLDQEHGFVARRTAKSAKVAIISGGGSGHEPLHTGYVGHGMLDAACAGHYFSSPTPGDIAAAAIHAERGRGALFVVKNYQGDVLNFALAAKLCPFPVESVLVTDDVATRDGELVAGRGLAGTIVVEKIVGAAAEAGLGLAALKRLGETVNAQTLTFGVALSSCRIPVRPIYDLAPGAMEIGVGIHGERGRDMVKAGATKQIAALLAKRVLARFAPSSTHTLMIVNGLGGTSQAQLKKLCHACVEILRHAGVSPVRVLAGTYVTALDTHGYSLTLAGLDETMLRYWDAPVQTAALDWR